MSFPHACMAAVAQRSTVYVIYLYVIYLYVIICTLFICTLFYLLWLIESHCTIGSRGKCGRNAQVQVCGFDKIFEVVSECNTIIYDYK